MGIIGVCLSSLWPRARSIGIIGVCCPPSDPFLHPVTSGGYMRPRGCLCVCVTRFDDKESYLSLSSSFILIAGGLRLTDRTQANEDACLMSVKHSGTPDCVPAVFLYRSTNGQELREYEESIRRSYSIQGAMQVCVLDRHSVKGPGVAAAHHVPPAWSLVSSCD